MEEPPKGPPEDLLSSWKEIAQYLDTTVRNAQRWEREAGMPVRRLLHKRKASVYAYRSEIETWRASRDLPAEVLADWKQPPADSEPASPRRFRMGLTVGLAIVSLAILAGSFRSERGPDHSPPVAPLTSLEGVEMSPAFSPDGSRVAFSWMPLGRSDFDIHILNVETGEREALAETELSEISPAWSRDGTKLAFLRLRDARAGLPESEIVVVTADGGEQAVLSGPPVSEHLIRWLPESYLAWTADGNALILSGGGPRRRGLYRFDLSTRNLDRLTHASEGLLGDFCPNLSPDGRLLAFVRKTGPFLGDVYVADLERPGAPVRRLTTWGRWTTTPTFTLDGREILVSSGTVGAERRFWSLDPAGKREPRMLRLAGEDSFGLALAPSQNEGRPRMAFARGAIRSDIWRATLGDDPGTARVIASSVIDSNPALSPDGERLVFESNRTGRPELWTSDGNGNDQQQLTTSAPPLAGPAEWSPDGTQLAVPAIVRGQVQVFRVSPDRGAMTQLTEGEGDKLNLRWAPDGKTIRFLLSRPGNLAYLAETPAEGGEIRRSLDGFNAVVVVESAAGDAFVGTSRGRMVPIENGRPAPPGFRVARPTDVRATESGLVFLSPAIVPGARGFYLRRYDGGRPELLAKVERPWLGLAVTADASKLYYSRHEESEIDLYLVDEVW